MGTSHAGYAHVRVAARAVGDPRRRADYVGRPHAKESDVGVFRRTVGDATWKAEVSHVRVRRAEVVEVQQLDAEFRALRPEPSGDVEVCGNAALRPAHQIQEPTVPGLPVDVEVPVPAEFYAETIFAQKDVDPPLEPR